MLVHVLKECECTLSFWHDKHWGDRWKDDSWVQKTKQETLKAGQEIKAIKVRQSTTHQDYCHIDITFLEDMKNCYMDVPRDSIEITES